MKAVFLSAIVIVFIFSPAAITAPESRDAAISSSTGQSQSLQGNWKINLDDEQNFSDPRYDDRSWDDIHLPGSMINYSISRGRGYAGVLWIRKKVYIDRSMSGKAMGLSLGG